MAFHLSRESPERQSRPTSEVHFFDFDHTLFYSPGPTPGTPKEKHREFWDDPESLGGDLVPSDPNSNWYVQQVIEQYQQAQKNPRAKVIVITGRSEPLRAKILKLLDRFGKPDELILKQKKEPTAPYKIREMKRVMDETPTARKIHFYEDREPHLREFQETAEKDGFYFIPHYVPEGPAERTWDQFMWTMYEGGARRVRNTNQETRDRYPTVRADHLLKNDPRFADLVRRQYRQWISAGRPSGAYSTSPDEKRGEGDSDEERTLLSLELDLERGAVCRVAQRWLLRPAR